MKTFRIIYIPHGKEDKEWVDIEAETKESALNRCNKWGVIISIRGEE